MRVHVAHKHHPVWRQSRVVKSTHQKDQRFCSEFVLKKKREGFLETVGNMLTRYQIICTAAFQIFSFILRDVAPYWPSTLVLDFCSTYCWFFATYTTFSAHTLNRKMEKSDIYMLQFLPTILMNPSPFYMVSIHLTFTRTLSNLKTLVQTAQFVKSLEPRSYEMFKTF